MNCALSKIVNLFKPAGPTSFEMVREVKRILGVKKAGHIGTLDPMAEGVLPICLNRSTRIIQFISSLPKVYTAGMELGTATDTQDATGKVIASGDADRVTEEDVRRTLESFVGPQQQVPPMFSAKKKNGIPLYKLARNGITIDRKPASIQIHSIEFLKKEGSRVECVVHCSTGTYIRTLCHDIGRELGCQAHMFRLVRDRVGVFNLKNSVTLEALQAATEDGSLPAKLFPLEKVLSFLPEIRVKSEYVKSVANGAALTKSSIETFPQQFKPGMNLRVSNGNNDLMAIAEPVVNQDDFVRLNPDEVAFKLKRVLI